MKAEINLQKNANSLKEDFSLNVNETSENLYKELLNFKNNCRNIKTAHFLAAQEKKSTYRRLGGLIIIINVAIFSPIFDLY